MKPLIIYPDSSSSEYILSTESRDIGAGLGLQYNSFLSDHWKLLSSVTPDARLAEPIMFIKARPRLKETSGGSFQRQSEAVRRRYGELSSYLRDMEKLPDPPVEQGSINTATAVLDHLSKRDIAPPELSWVGSEAIVMLWALGDTKYALTVTDGELGYVVRARGETLRKDHDISLTNFDIRHLA